MPLLLFLLLAALGMDRQGAVVDGDLDVLVRVQAGELGPDDEAVVLHVVLDPERLSRRERQQGRQGRLQPVQQLREYGGGPSGRPRCPHFLPPFLWALGDLPPPLAPPAPQPAIPALPVRWPLRRRP